eukprot:CAMPEP_0119376748 /NCGR_PEP_ID=MMETSP1334-20130426/41097_1 /TAXON_ID=127549 /ORGANISM="Calcidiscus leptoporus, Strain RCC1130" /LENGTH=160 /DNA_ID=CAMNT_0007395409 /DNA_START=247 /DNA_END=726 /DNA_ORIENTATION=+
MKLALSLYTTPRHELPCQIVGTRQEESDVRLVVGGDPKGVYEDADYLKLNTGVMLWRVHPWSMNLLDQLFDQGHRDARQGHAHSVQQFVRNLCFGCFDDQAALIALLHKQPSRWQQATLLERRFPLQGYWEDYATAMPDVPVKANAPSALRRNMRPPGAA